MKTVIIGAGTNAMTVADILIHDRNTKIAGFIGTQEEEARLSDNETYGGLPFLGSRDLLTPLKENGVAGFIVAIANNRIREEAYYEALHKGLTPVSAVSHRAIIEPSADVGSGVVISAGCIVSHGVSIGSNTYIGSGVILEINSKIGENCLIGSGSIVCGESTIGRNVALRARCTVSSYVTVGKNQVVDAATVVREDLRDLMRSPE